MPFERTYNNSNRNNRQNYRQNDENDRYSRRRYNNYRPRLHDNRQQDNNSDNRRHNVLSANDIQTIVESLARRLNNNHNNNQRNNQGNNTEPIVRDNTYHQQGDRPIPTSTNPDFPIIWRTLFKIIQIEHHLGNWDTVPPTIEKTLTNLATDITPPEPTDGLSKEISDILTLAGESIKQRVQAHLHDRLEVNKATLQMLNPIDKDRAIEVAHKHLNRRLGKKITNLRSRVEDEALWIGFELGERSADVGLPRTTTTTTATTRVTLSAKRTLTGPTQNTLPSDLRQLRSDVEIELMDTRAPITEPPSNTHLPSTSAIQPSTLPLNEPPSLQRRSPRKVIHDRQGTHLFIKEHTKVIVFGDSYLSNTPDEYVPDNWQLEILPDDMSTLEMTRLLKQTSSGRSFTIILAYGMELVEVNLPFDDIAERSFSQLSRLHEFAGDQAYAVGMGHGATDNTKVKDTVIAVNHRLQAIFGDNYIAPPAPHEIQTTENIFKYDPPTLARFWSRLPHGITIR